MSFFSGHISLRILLLILSAVFFFYMPDILDVKYPALGIPYVCATCFLVFVAMFGKFKDSRSRKKNEDTAKSVNNTKE